MEFQYYIYIVIGVLAIVYVARGLLIAYSKWKWKKLNKQMTSLIKDSIKNQKN